MARAQVTAVNGSTSEPISGPARRAQGGAVSDRPPVGKGAARLVRDPAPAVTVPPCQSRRTGQSWHPLKAGQGGYE